MSSTCSRVTGCQADKAPSSGTYSVIGQDVSSIPSSIAMPTIIVVRVFEQEWAT